MAIRDVVRGLNDEPGHVRWQQALCARSLSLASVGNVYGAVSTLAPTLVARATEQLIGVARQIPCPVGLAAVNTEE